MCLCVLTATGWVSNTDYTTSAGYTYLHACLATGYSTEDFAGTFATDDCVNSNPTAPIPNAFTGAETCPSGFTEYQVYRTKSQKTACGFNTFACYVTPAPI